MKRVPLILLSLFLILPVLLNGHLIYDAVNILKSQGAARAQGDFSFYYIVPFYGGGAAILSLLGLHFCSVAGVKGRHLLHMGFVITTLLPFAIFFIFQFLWDRT
ncbi:MAG TPA: hypothetical protein VHG71_08360 [Verrucomicrobiae bacterium]|nr:hypothetical protein [Verrucomicrobiae bacterium]